jgi:hypothetical protein
MLFAEIRRPGVADRRTFRIFDVYFARQAG